MKTKLNTWYLKNPLSEKRFELLTIHFHNFGDKTELKRHFKLPKFAIIFHSKGQQYTTINRG